MHTTEQKVSQILRKCLENKTTDVYKIFEAVTTCDFVNMHGPEHHIIDGACVLVAYHNAGGKIDIGKALQEMASQGQKMPGATCGKWGVCGAVTSVGAALAIIDGTGPLTKDKTWGSHMAYTASVLSEMSKTGGPRCCKRDGMIALKMAVSYINTHCPVKLKWSGNSCVFHSKNPQCIKGRCPYFVTTA